MPGDSFLRSPSTRIHELRRSGLLDRPGDEQFSHLTELVRQMLDVPVAIVSIVDEHRQVFAGHSGMPEPWASLGETPITHSFCQHVVDRGTVFVVPDAMAEPLVRDNLAIPDLGVAAYLGVPIHMPGGELIGALAAIDTVPREWTPQDIRLLESVAVIVDKEIRVGASERKFRTLFEQMREGFYVGSVVRSPDGTVTDFLFEEVNPSFGRLTGVDTSRANGTLLSVVSPSALSELLPVFERLLQTRTPVVHVSPSTLRVGRWFETRMTPLSGERLIGFFSDVTERRKAEELQDVLNQEMSHRLKNTLMMVQALAMQTLRTVTEREPVQALEKRIHALSSAHDILFRRNWHDAPVQDIAEAAFGRLCMEGRVDFEGPDFEFGAKATLSLSLLLHELITNAVKYGALSNDTGRVTLSWSVDAGHFHMVWKESGGPVVVEPARKGFGYRLIRMGLGSGSVTTEYRPEGFFLELSTPLLHLQQA
ncbi:GAF domain-containing protein [Bacillus sp. NP157]|nr:GAF domain-containing protein [Bacillus sp. NP157]